MDQNDLISFALRLAKLAENEILPLYNDCVINFKADGSEVTEADKKAEHVITENIMKIFPNHSILGEEFGLTNDSNNQYQWIIDPLDGTTWFSLGVPIFGTLIALLKDGIPFIGVIHFPITSETVYASRGMGCWLRKANNSPKRIQVSSKLELNDSFVSASGVHNSDITSNKENPFNLREIINKAKKFRFCGDCMQHALLCRGKLDVAIDTIMQPWDTAAIIPCIEEAGGIATTLDGKREGVVFGGSLLSTCNETLHNEILSIINAR
jgi:histidinol-phosphatase